METSEVLNTVPTEAVAGTTIKWSMSLAHTPASGFTATIKIINAAGDNVSKTATPSADNQSYDFRLAPADTQALTTGAFYYQVSTTDGTDIYLETSGEITFNTKIGAEALDARSFAQKIVDAIDDIALGKATRDQQSYQIGTRQLSRIPVHELLELRKYYNSMLDQEIRKARLAAGKSIFPSLKIKF